MPSGNGNRAKMKRERNAKKNEQKGGASKSQLKANEAAKSVLCNVCRQTWMKTVSPTELKQHHEAKHSKLPYDQCFDQ